MTQSFERVKSRLDNIQSIKPLLSALRTLSMSEWQLALTKIEGIRQYEENFHQIIAEILPKVKFSRTKKSKNHKKNPSLAERIILIVGTERGLCGRFNRILAENTLTWIKDQGFSSYQIWALGTRMVQELSRMGVTIDRRNPFQTNDISNYQLAYLAVQNWLSLYEEGAFNQFIIIFNRIARGGQYSFTWRQLLPFEIQQFNKSAERSINIWPPPIIETDPQGIYHQIIDQYIASTYYQTLLQSTAAENASRYRLMEDAKENALEIIKELKTMINIERKRRITQEMQELASGSGLLEK